MKLPQYVNVRDANMRLKNAVIMWGGEPVYVNGIDGNEDENSTYIMRYSSVRDLNKVSTVDIFDKVIEPPQFKLGYVNSIAGAIFTKRVPVRRYKNGLTAENTRFDCSISSPEIGMNFNKILNDPGFYHMLKGQYPTLKDAVKSETSAAFCRQYAVKRISLEVFHLYFKGVHVGEYSLKENKVTLYKFFRFLKEDLQRKGNFLLEVSDVN